MGPVFTSPISKTLNWWVSAGGHRPKEKRPQCHFSNITSLTNKLMPMPGKENIFTKYFLQIIFVRFVFLFFCRLFFVYQLFNWRHLLPWTWGGKMVAAQRSAANIQIYVRQCKRCSDIICSIICIIFNSPQPLARPARPRWHIRVPHWFILFFIYIFSLVVLRISLTGDVAQKNEKYSTPKQTNRWRKKQNWLVFFGFVVLVLVFCLCVIRGHFCVAYFVAKDPTADRKKGKRKNATRVAAAWAGVSATLNVI